MQVKLSSAPNPDYGQTESPAPARVVEVATLEEASAVCRQYISQHELGGGNWDGGQIYQDGQETHHVSYNGRVWES